MRRSSWIGIGILAVAAGFLIYAYLPFNQIQMTDVYDLEERGVQMNVVTNGEQFTEGETIQVEATLTNELEAPITYNTYCNEGIIISVTHPDFEGPLQSNESTANCEEEAGETKILVPNEQLTVRAAFSLEVVLDGEEELAPSGQYEWQVRFVPTAQESMVLTQSVTVDQPESPIIPVQEVRQGIEQEYEAGDWYEQYGTSERYLVEEDLPFLENGQWNFRYRATSTDQTSAAPEEELLLTADAKRETND